MSRSVGVRVLGCCGREGGDLVGRGPRDWYSSERVCIYTSMASIRGGGYGC